jgi:Na+-translocating ferredoxin:NAD+ oxidoreductase subunit C
MLKEFSGGIHPYDGKKYTRGKNIEDMPLVGRYCVPLKQHIGEACAPIVSKGYIVKKGQCIADGNKNRSVPIHAPVSGVIADIGLYRDPVAGMSKSIIIDNDGKDEWLEGRLIFRDYKDLDAASIVDIIRECGVVGMGGAAFPAHKKLSPPANKPVDLLVVNGAECEPYLTSDYRVMLEYPEDVISGCLISMKTVNAKYCRIGIEDNKKDAIVLMQKHAAVHKNITIIPLPSVYPQGGEKMLVKAISNREVSSGKLPMDAGCVVINVSTMKAIADAVGKNIPLIERIVTVSGSSITCPKNIRARIGTGFNDAIAFCGGLKRLASTIIMGGPMMGFAQTDAGVPIVKACSGILAFSEHNVGAAVERPCIRCGRCRDACPMRLRPNMLSILSERNKYKTALLEYDLLDCIECGCCAYVCPAKRNIVQHVRKAKAQNIMNKKRKELEINEHRG